MLRLFKKLVALADLERHSNVEKHNFTRDPDLAFDSTSGDDILPIIESLERLLTERALLDEQAPSSESVAVRIDNEELSIEIHASSMAMPGATAAKALATVHARVAGASLECEYRFAINGFGDSEQEAVKNGIQNTMKEVVNPIVASILPGDSSQFCEAEDFVNKYNEPWTAYYQALPQHLIDGATTPFSFSQFLQRTHDGYLSDQHLNVLRIRREMMTDDNGESEVYESTVNHPLPPQDEICGMNTQGWPNSAIPTAAPKIAFLRRR